MTVFDMSSGDDSQAPAEEQFDDFGGMFAPPEQPYSGIARITGVKPTRNDKGAAIFVEFTYGDQQKISSWCGMIGAPGGYNESTISMGRARLRSIYTACGWSFSPEGLPINPNNGKKGDWTGLVGTKCKIEVKPQKKDPDRLEVAKVTAA